MSIKRRFDPISFDGTVTLQVPPLNEADLVHIQRALIDIAPDWTVELEGICSEEATLVLLPDDGEDASGPSFVISREPYGLRVDQLHWDEVTEIGIFTSLNDVLDVLRLQLGFYGTATAPASATLH